VSERVRVAVLGHGVVGRGVAELLTRPQNGVAAAKFGREPELGAVLDIRDFPDAPYSRLFARSFDDILADESIAVFAETIGGVRAAYDYTKRALAAGRHVVTSNKELVSTHGASLLRLARERNVNYMFEASVGGGIPVIRPLARSFAADRITAVSGILNGTTNFVLTKMAEDGRSMLAALDEARERGYAEADPSDDMEGKDTCRKIAILASLAFGRHIYPKYIPTFGISYITAAHIAQAAALGCAIKLLGRAGLREDGLTDIITAPFLVPFSHPFCAVRDVYNAVFITADRAGDVMLYGRGAGREPTASAVLADIYDCVRHIAQSVSVLWEDTKADITAAGAPDGARYAEFPDGSKMRYLPT
jgi:homoserine dehydrogenase